MKGYFFALPPYGLYLAAVTEGSFFLAQLAFLTFLEVPLLVYH